MALFQMIGSMFQVSAPLPKDPPPVPADTSASIPEEEPKSETVSGAETVDGRSSGAKIGKAHIGAPSGFKHVAHIGFRTRFNTAPDLQWIFRQAGFQDDIPTDQRTSRKIFDLLERKGTKKAARQEALNTDLPDGPSSSCPVLQPLPSTNISGHPIVMPFQTPPMNDDSLAANVPPPTQPPPFNIGAAGGFVPPAPPLLPCAAFASVPPPPLPPFHNCATIGFVPPPAPPLAPPFNLCAAAASVPPPPAPPLPPGFVFPPLQTPFKNGAAVESAQIPPAPPLPELPLSFNSSTLIVPPPMPPLGHAISAGAAPLPTLPLTFSNYVQPPQLLPPSHSEKSDCPNRPTGNGTTLNDASDHKSANTEQPSLLDQIKRVKLKSVTGVTRPEALPASDRRGIVSALMDAIQSRKRATHSEETGSEEEWED